MISNNQFYIFFQLAHLVNGEMIVGMSVRVSTEHNVIRFRETALAHQDGTVMKYDLFW